MLINTLIKHLKKFKTKTQEKKIQKKNKYDRNIHVGGFRDYI